jgi:tetratricopeptide (TPR) repeat protein
MRAPLVGLRGLEAAAAILLLLQASPAAAFWTLRARDPLKEVSALFAAKNYDEVIKIVTPQFIAKLKTKNAAKAQWLRAESLAEMGRFSRALSVFELATKLYPRDQRLQLGFAELLRGSDLPKQAQAVFEGILRKDPASPQARLGLARTQQALGYYDRSAGNYRLALEDSSQARNPDVWRLYAETLSDSGRWDEAKTAVEKALSLRQDAAAYLDLALIQRSQGRLDAAIAALKEARERPNASPALGRALGLWLLEAHKAPEALQEARKLLKTDPRDSLAHWVAAMADQSLGHLIDARREMRLAADFSEKTPFVAAVSQKILKTWGDR